MRDVASIWLGCVDLLGQVKEVLDWVLGIWNERPSVSRVLVEDQLGVRVLDFSSV